MPLTPLATWTPPAPTGLLYYATYVGDWTRSLLHQTRRLSDDWYRNALRSVLIAKCVADGGMSRCVPTDSADADRYTNSTCVRMFDAGNCHDRHLCERAMSCRWSPPSGSATSIRVEFFDDEQADAATLWATIEYPKSIAPYALLGLVMACVVLVSIILFAILRFGCGRCYGTSPLRKGYTVVDRWLPIMAVAVSTAMLVALGLVVCLLSPGYIRGISRTLDTLHDTATSLVQIHADLSRPLTDLATSFRTARAAFAGEPTGSSLAASSLSLLPLDVANVTNASHAFIDRFSASRIGSFPSYACRQPAPTAPPYAATSNMPCIACPDVVCGDAAPRLDAMLTPVAAVVHEIESLAGWARDHVDAVAATTDLDAILSALSSLGTSAAAFSSTVYPPLHDILGRVQVGGFSAVLAAFATALAASVLALVGILHGLRSPTSGCLYVLHLSWILAISFAITGFVASGALAAASVVANDLCRSMAVVLQTPEPFLPPPAAALVRTCAIPPQPSSAADDMATALVALELDNLTRLGCVLHTGLVASNATVADKLGQAAAAMQSYSAQLARNAVPTAFVNDGLARFLVAQASAAAAAPWTPHTIRTPWTAHGLVNATQSCSGAAHPALCYMYERCGDAKGCFEKFETAYAYVTAYDEIEAVAAAMHVAFDAGDERLARQVQAVVDALRAAATTQQAQLQQSPIGDVARRTRGLQCVSSISCGFVRTSAAKLEHYFCKDTARFTALAAAALFVASGLYLCLALATLMLQKRLQGRVKMMWWKRRSVLARQKKRGTAVPSSVSSSDSVAGPPPRPVRISGLVIMPELQAKDPAMSS
ncbi:hypothetical protein H310_13216 [Aphanomyces invadans]|uniref:Uncharacterized protein n=1 Tax=Aphanomyces invadans TaxID=157072 RepID=A0A024TGT5_9STRA|nr:hypothetical protein H310_13216 [Aphanomyces invadans]ETV92552.1 hypothetical protein H310_13216 [Aphanomyces invadans]|eukprot:XP_008878859.1 hypothetical protein H310_13216 [Aphanomyces invadans]